MGEHYTLAPLENHVAVYTSPMFARKCRLRLANILNLTKILYDRIGQWVKALLGMLSVKAL